MRTFWWTSRYEAGEHFSMYTLVRNVFSDPVYDVLYLVALFLLGFHLHHGFQSALQTFGLREKKYVTLIEWCGVIVWLLIPLGFAVMPVYFYLTLR
jgi:succinate dehydrogenase / fumarate reductase cytochrome b subunit